MSLCSLASQSAHAGQWVLDHCELSGSDSITNWWYWGPSYPFWFNPTFTWPSTSPDGVAGGAGYCDSSSSEGSVTAVFHWSPSYAGEAPSKQFYIHVSSYAYASTVLEHETAAEYAASSQALSVDNGFDDPITGDGGDYETEKETHGQHTLSVDATGTETRKTFHISASGGYAFDGWNDSTDYDMNISVVDYQPKSVMIGGAGGTQEYVGGEWKGKGDTLYNNYEGDPMNPFEGSNYGQLSWSPSLIGGPWPAFADWQAGWFTRDWHWFSDGQSASGSDYTSPPFATDRPHVDWPWDSDGQYIPRDFLEECKNAPASQSKHIFLHLTDSDQLGTHPEWSFDKTANTYVTFHSQHELVEEQATQEVPTSENPWQIIVLRGGTNVQASGPFTSWQPTIYFEANQDFGISFNGAAWILDSGVSFSTGTNQGYNLSVNPQPIPASQHGAVYWHRSIIRHPFTYNQYTVDGLEYESYDANGVGQPFHGHVDRSRGWPNAPNDMDAKIVLSDSDRGFPETIDHD